MAGRWPMRAATVWRATALATSPAAWPPIPSATAKTLGDGEDAVLVGRADPAGIGRRAPAQLGHQPTRSAGGVTRLQDGVADLQLVAGPQHGRARQAHAR